MRKAVIHIGAHKTGTSSIQKSLLDGLQNLKAKGIYYPSELTEGKFDLNGQHFLVWNFQRKIYPDYQRAIDQAGSKFCEIVKDLEQDLLLSSEEFALLDDNSIRQLKEILADFEIVVVLYVRRQDDAATGLYQTEIMTSGESAIFFEWIKRKYDVFDYFSIAERWARETQGKLIVVPYDKDRLKGGDSVTDFQTLIAGIFDREIIIPIPAERLNESLPASIARIARFYNSRTRKVNIAPALFRLGNELKKMNFSSGWPLISPSMRKNLLETYKDSNLALSKKYLGLEEVWFKDETVDMSEEEWIRLTTLEGSDLLEIVNHCWQAISGRVVK